MEIRHSITLSTTEPNNEVGIIKIRQADEQTQTLEVQITENGVPKSYQGLAVYFCAKLGQTAGLGIIEQKLNPEEMTDPANGKLEYTMRAEDWQILGRQKGYFSFRRMKDEHEFIEQFTTRDFTFDVIKSVYSDGLKEVKKDGSTYVWTIEDMIRLFKEYIATGKTDWENYKNDEKTIWEKFVEDNREFLETADPGGKIILELLGARGDAYPTLGERLDSEKAEVSVKLSQIAIYLDERLEDETDDTLRLQRTLDYLKAQYDLGNHYKLLLPPDTLKISSTLTLKQVKGVTIEGSGKGVTIIENTGVGNAFEIGVMESDSWDEALKTVVNLKNVSIKGNVNSGHGLKIHSVGSVIEGCSFDYHGKIGLYSNGLSFLRVLNSDFTYNKIGIYARWSTNFDGIHITHNTMLGGYLGEACKITNSLVEWQCPPSGCGPRLPGLIIKGGTLHQAIVQNTYLEHDYFYIGYNQTLDPETGTFGAGRIENGNTILDNCVISDQSIVYIDSGNLSVKSVSFPGSNFGIQPMRTYAQYTTVGLTPPKITYDLGTEKLNIGRSSSFFYAPTTQKNIINNPSFYGISSKDTGNNTELVMPYGWKVRDHLWKDSDFNLNLTHVTDVPAWSIMQTALKYDLPIVPTGLEIPKLTYDFMVEEGKIYYLSFDYKTTGTCLYVVEGLVTGENYLHTDYKIGGIERKYDSFDSPVWARIIKSFKAQKTETVRLIFQSEVKAIGRGFTITNVCISEDGGLSKPEKGMFIGTFPTAGNWKVGDVVYNSSPSASTPTEKWLRVTDGSSNVLGTDWIAK